MPSLNIAIAGAGIDKVNILGKWVIFRSMLKIAQVLRIFRPESLGFLSFKA